MLCTKNRQKKVFKDVESEILAFQGSSDGAGFCWKMQRRAFQAEGRAHCKGSLCMYVLGGRIGECE